MGFFDDVGKELEELGNNVGKELEQLGKDVNDTFGPDGKVIQAVEHLPGAGYTLAAVHTITGNDEAAQRAFNSSNNTIKGAVDVAKYAVENFGMPPP
ncbi:hypothetical protein FRB90_000604 [Tulasnella sp. 427]|nr:hypothetical protein FRB90_000604 [Tulasnella sp. 427]